jgi:hypothetical protein
MKLPDAKHDGYDVRRLVVFVFLGTLAIAAYFAEPFIVASFRGIASTVMYAFASTPQHALRNIRTKSNAVSAFLHSKAQPTPAIFNLKETA